jgi:hypothetical protein
MKTCFYCGEKVTRIEKDHSPVPKRHGGKDIVDACLTCHDMKDRVMLEDWPDEWWNCVTDDMPKMSKPTKLFLMKFVAGVLDHATNDKKVRFNDGSK